MLNIFNYNENTLESDLINIIIFKCSTKIKQHIMISLSFEPYPIKNQSKFYSKQ